MISTVIRALGYCVVHQSSSPAPMQCKALGHFPARPLIFCDRRLDLWIPTDNLQHPATACAVLQSSGPLEATAVAVLDSLQAHGSTLRGSLGRKQRQLRHQAASSHRSAAGVAASGSCAGEREAPAAALQAPAMGTCSSGSRQFWVPHRGGPAAATTAAGSQAPAVVCAAATPTTSHGAVCKAGARPDEPHGGTL